MEITQFPVEIIEKLMSYLDSESLLVIASTCKLLNCIAQKFLNDNNWWKTCCYNEIGIDNISAILQRKDKPINWSFIATCGRRWNNIQYWNIKVLLIFNCKDTVKFTERLTCTRKLDDSSFLINAPKQGLAFNDDKQQWQVLKLNTSSSVFTYQGKIIDVNNFIATFQTEDVTNLKIKKILDRNTVWSNCVDIDYSNRRIVYYTVYKDLREIKFDKEEKFEFIAKNYHVGDIIAMSFRDKRVYLLSEFGDLLKLKDNRIVRVHGYNFSNYIIRKAFLFLQTVFLLTMDDLIIIIKDNTVSEYHNTKMIFGSSVRTIFLYGKLLFVGLESGKVFIYYCNNLPKINFSMYSHKIQVSWKPLVHIEIDEQIDSLHIVFTSFEDVHEMIITDNRYIVSSLNDQLTTTCDNDKSDAIKEIIESNPLIGIPKWENLMDGDINYLYTHTYVRH